MKAKNNTAGQYVVFLIDKQLYSLPIEEVVEILRIQPITEVPNTTRDYIAGVINLRGNVIPIVHLRKIFSVPLISLTKKHRIIIVKSEGEEIGLIVDEVRMVTFFNENEIETPSNISNNIESKYFNGFSKINDNVIGILNLEEVLELQSSKGAYNIV